MSMSGFAGGPNSQFIKLDDTDTQRLTASQDGAGGAQPIGRTRSKPGGNLGKAMQFDRDSPDIVDRKVKALLNELTMEKFDSISDQVIAWANKSEKEKDGRTLVQVIRLVFEKATDEATSEMYARLCRKMMEQISSKVQDDGIKATDGKPIAGGQLFRKYLLNRCQEDFERGWVANEATAAAAVKASEDEAAKAVSRQSRGGGSEKVALYSDEYHAAQKARRQGLVKFLGELFKVQMLTERIMHECIKKLLGNVENPKEEEIESLCTLLTTAGASLDTPKARAHMDVYFSRMKELSKSQNVSSRVQLVLQDTIDLRERRWTPHNAVAAPATIAQLHAMAAKEKAAQDKESYNQQIGMSRGGNRGEFASVGPDGWAVAGGGSGGPRPPPKVGDLSNFGKISKTQPMTFGPSSVFASMKGAESKREIISRIGGGKSVQVGPDGWAFAGSGSGVRRPPPKVGDLSNFGKSGKPQPMTSGHGDVFADKKGIESKRESIARTDDRREFAQVGPDGWAVAGSGSAALRPPPKAGDLSIFGKISKAQPVTSGSARVSAGKKGRESELEAISPTSSSSDMFFIPSQNAEAGVDTTAKAAAESVERKNLVLQPRFQPAEDAEAAPSDVESEVNSSRDEASPEMSDEDAKKKIADDSKESPEPQIQDFREIQKTVDVARRRIDQDIEKMEGAIRALKSRRNSLAPISRLPPEILLKIFVCCAATCKPDMDWVKVTHVSRHWRTVAIGCPRLWSTLTFMQPRWVEEMLKRSKMAPLVIDAHFGSYMDSNLTKAIQLAMNHISRVQELSIVSQNASLEIIFSSLPRAAPALQILMLSGSTNHYVDRFWDSYSIPPELFSDDSSQLRRLELNYCNLDWTSHLLKGLTHLKIHNTAPRARPSMSLFLDVLEQVPALAVLDLHDALPHVADGFSTVSYQRNVKLRSLTNLDLAGSASDCSTALRHLSVSSSAALKLACRSTVVSGAEISSILTFVSGLWGPTAIGSSAEKPHKCPIRSLRIQRFGSGDSDSTGLQAWPTVLSFHTKLSEDPDPPPFIDLYFQWSSATDTRGIGDKVIAETCAALPLGQLVSLDASSQMTQQTLLRTFGKLAHLRSIRAEGLAIRTLLSAMIAEPSATATSTNVSTNLSTWKHSHNRRELPLAVYFPSLVHLAIENTNFDSGYNGKYAKRQDLKECLRERYERKAEVRELTLSRCYGLTTELVDELRKVVVDVIWDEWETDDSEDDYDDDTDDHSYSYFDD